MKISTTEFVALGQIMKAAQEAPPALPAFMTKRKHVRPDAAYPDYSKSITGQMKQNPQVEGLKRGLGSGALGAVLGALATRLLTSDPSKVMAGAGVGGVIGAVPGYSSGKREAESDYSRLLYLRRLGIHHPGQMEIAMKYPDLTSLAKTKGKLHTDLQG